MSLEGYEGKKLVEWDFFLAEQSFYAITSLGPSLIEPRVPTCFFSNYSTSRKGLILLEDLSDCPNTFHYVTGLPIELTAKIVKSLAEYHAFYWDLSIWSDNELQTTLEWLKRINDADMVAWVLS
jgi:hypothetical protein